MNSIWWNGEKCSYLLKVTDKARYYIERDLPANMELLETHNGHQLVRIYFYNDMELFAYVKSWMPWMRIVDDAELERQVEEFLRQT